MVDLDSQENRQELLMLSPSFKVPKLQHDGIEVYSVLAIAAYLNETFPDAGLWPKAKAARAHCRSVSGEMKGGFFTLRSALPMNIKTRYDKYKVFTGARPDIERIKEIWTECLEKYKGPFLFGKKPTVADAMFAPICTRFRTYNVELPEDLQAYCDTIFEWPLMQEWVHAAEQEPEAIEELDIEF